MLRAADRQHGFFDAAWCADLLPADSFYVLLAEHGERIVRDEDFADCYSETHGRPSIPPSLLSKVLLLAFREGLSDERAMQAVRFDLRWKVALDLPIDHPGFHPTSLVRFRARLLLHGKERLVFEQSIELATELGLLDGPAEQIVDSTPMLGAAAVQDTAVLVRSAVGKLIDAVAAADIRAAGELRERCVLRTRARARSPRVTGLSADRGCSCSARSPEMRSARCMPSRHTASSPTTNTSPRQHACWARSSARNTTSTTRRIRGPAAGAGYARSCRVWILRCATAARHRGGALRATSCMPRSPPTCRS